MAQSKEDVELGKYLKKIGSDLTVEEYRRLQKLDAQFEDARYQKLKKK